MRNEIAVKKIRKKKKKEITVSKTENATEQSKVLMMNVQGLQQNV